VRIFTPTVIALVIALAVVAEVFIAFPGIDLAVSRLFFTPGKGFLLQDTAISRFVNQDMRRGLTGFMIVVAVVTVVVLIRRRPFLGVDGRGYLFIVLSFALAVGLLVNEGFKGQSGRARPKYVTEFDGELAFTPAFVPSDQCRQNCSFVSGDASFAFGMLAFALVAARYRRHAVVAALAFGVVMSAQRVMQGKHFFSDVVIAGLITALFVLVLYRLMVVYRWPPPGALTALAAAVRSAGGRMSRLGHALAVQVKPLGGQRPADGDGRGQDHVAQVVGGGEDGGQGGRCGDGDGSPGETGAGIGQDDPGGQRDHGIRDAGEELERGEVGCGLAAASQEREGGAWTKAIEQYIETAQQHHGATPAQNDEQPPTGVIGEAAGGGLVSDRGAGQQRPKRHASGGTCKDPRVEDAGKGGGEGAETSIGQAGGQGGDGSVQQQDADQIGHGYASGDKAGAKRGSDRVGDGAEHGPPYRGAPRLSTSRDER